MNIPRLFGTLVVLGTLVACQSAPPVAEPAPTPVVAPEPEPTPPPTPEPVAQVPDSIETVKEGFSPRAQNPANVFELSLRWGTSSPTQAWEVRITDTNGVTVKVFAGNQRLPSLTWDGRTDAGAEAPSGRYTAVLWTGSPLGEVARTKPFLLDLVPPSGILLVTPRPYVPGQGDLTIKLVLNEGDAPWATWRLGVIHPDGRRFRDFLNEEYRQATIVWDGRAMNNALLEAGTTYRLEAEVFDVWGNKGTVVADLVVEAPPMAARPQATVPEPGVLTVTLDGKQLAEWPLYFPPFSSELARVGGDLRQTNETSMDKLAELLLSHPGTKVTVVGHANQVFYNDRRGPREQEEVLLPLSLSRAERVRAALISRGIDAVTLSVRGVGALDPVAPFSDPETRWQNRRVVVELSR